MRARNFVGGMAVTGARRFRRRLSFAALTCCLLLCFKLIWFSLMAPSAGSRGAGDAGADVAMRRAYLLHRVANEQFGTGDMPSIVASPYREELAIATLSMTTVALTNLSFIHPSDRVANRDAVRVMLSRILSSVIRRYDVIWWGEDGPTDLVSGPLIFGLSPSATGFAMGGAALWNDQGTLTGLLRTAEMVGSSVSFGGRRWYLFAPLPGDAVVLAARTMTRWDSRFVGLRPPHS